MSISPGPLTLANALTAARLTMAPCIAFAIADDRSALAGLLFVLAVVTDLADGPLARRDGQTTPFGGLFDHSVDACFVTMMLAALAWRGELNGWLPIFVAASFTQYVVDSEALRGHRLRTSRIGRSNGIAYYVAGGMPVIRDALGLPWPPTAWVQLFAWVLVLTSAISMAERGLAFWRIRRRFGASD